MRPEVDAVYASAKAPFHTPEASARLKLSMQAGPICILPRLIEPGMAAMLDDMTAEQLPCFDLSGRLRQMHQPIRTALETSVGLSAALRLWLADDIIALAELYAATTGSRALRVRLQIVDNDMCRRFHVDNVAFRLVTTYRGPGTEWLSPRLIALAEAGQPIGAEHIRQLTRGTIAIMRGGRQASSDRPGLPHRSPPIEGSGQVRLFLAINETHA